MVIIHHLPGWDEWTTEVARKFAHHGYAAISPHLYFRDGPGSPDDVGARVRGAGFAAMEVLVIEHRTKVAIVPPAHLRVGHERRFGETTLTYLVPVA